MIKVAIHHFVQHNLDAIFLATNAPGRSAYNRVERRMAPLSKQLSGVLLEHEFFGSHLDSQMRTVDPELEKKNFGHAGQTLAALWSDMRLDDYPVFAEYVEPNQSELTNLTEKDPEWFANHVRSSQYFLQVVKCLNKKCCTPFRSSLLTVLPNRFIPPPIPLYQTDFGLKAPNPGNLGNKNFASLFVISSLDLYKVLPNAIQIDNLAFDTYCPSVYKRIKERTCKTCKLYFASNVIQKMHCQIHKTDTTARKIRPKRVICRRADEVLAVTPEDEMEWFETDDMEELVVTEEVECEECCPVLTLDARMEMLWSSETD